MKKGKVLIAAPIHEVLGKGLEAEGYQLLYIEDITQELGLQLVKDCVGIITSTRLQVNQQMIDEVPGLQFIARMGSGMELIDVPYAESKGIRCLGSPEGNCNAVAEHALGMLLSLNKRIGKSYNEIKEGKWLRDENRGTELEGKTIGIIGYGHTGMAFAKLLRAFDMKILVYDKYKKIKTESHIVVCDNLDQIQEETDALSIHVPFQEDTFHLVNASFLRQFQKPIILINTSRGAVIDSSSLIKSLDNGKIKALALDVWEEEPLSKMSLDMRNTLQELMQYPNVLITPHIAGYSFEALYKMSLILLQKITK
ncbi:MAG: NAD(P)-dependent oxidoreductase [Phycisphaerales bacterium]|nr:NAD(P)-dependent oxidoreductase [Phycisphaerales bacterium]